MLLWWTVTAIDERCPNRRNPSPQAATGTQRPAHSRTGGATPTLQKFFYRRLDGVMGRAAGKRQNTIGPAFPGQFRGRLTLKSRHSFSIRVVYKLCKESVIRPSFFLFLFFFFRFKLVCVLRWRASLLRSRSAAVDRSIWPTSRFIHSEIVRWSNASFVHLQLSFRCFLWE